MDNRRIVGIETEYGIVTQGDPYRSAIAASSSLVAAYYPSSRGGIDAPPVGWDYRGEDPLKDQRGHRLARASADPSLLTDDPSRPAPSGPTLTELERTSRDEARLPRAHACVLANGARFYVDHAHPEYSSPECRGAREAVIYDRAGDAIARDAMAAAAALGDPIVLFKNNVDGKGASYGAHENYLLRRDVDFSTLTRAALPFLATRPLICGAGRVGIGQRSDQAGFQISQRADYIENTIGLETTFNRPLINTRDEPHAEASAHRRLHIICGDANQFDVSTYLRIGTLSALLWAIETGHGHAFDDLTACGDIVCETAAFSHDLTLTHTMDTVGGIAMSALDIQRAYLERIADLPHVADDDERVDVLAQWERVLNVLATDPIAAATDIEWVAKYELFNAMRERWNTTWADPRLQALDLRWADLRPDRSPLGHLEKAGRIRRLASPDEIAVATTTPPQTTRAAWRGLATRYLPGLTEASWTSLIFDTGQPRLTRVALPDPAAAPTAPARTAALSGDVDAFVALLAEGTTH